MRFRIACVGDTHVNEDARFDEHQRIMGWIIDDAVERECVAMVHGGDWSEYGGRGRGTTAKERLANASWCRTATHHMPLIGIAGNHDDTRDIELLSRLTEGDPRNALHILKAPGIVNVRVRPRSSDPMGIEFACLPWPRKAHLLAALPPGEDANAYAAMALRNILREFGESWTVGVPRVFVGHCSIAGSALGPNQPVMIGHDFELGLEDLALAQAHVYVLGHIHKAQDWVIGGRPVLYTGDPRPMDYGETEPKSYTVLEFEDGRLTEWYRVPTPFTPLVTVDAAYAPADAEHPESVRMAAPSSPQGAEIKLRYSTPATHRDAARRGMLEMRKELLKQGARSVDLEESVTVETRARAPEIALAPTLRDQVEAFWQSKGYEPGERRSPILDKLASLDEVSE